MNTLEAIHSRRSVRAYLAGPIPRETIEALVAAALWAPTASNRQEVAFVAVTDPADIAAIQPFAPGMRGRPAAILVACVDHTRVPAARGAGQSTTVADLDVGMAVQNVLLAAHDAGLGACAIHSFRPEAVAAYLRLRPSLQPALLVAMGYPARVPPAPRRRPLSEALLWGRQEVEAEAGAVAQPAVLVEPEESAPPPREGLAAADPRRDGTLQVIWLLSCARGLMDEPLRYGPMRLLDAACRFTEYLQRRGLAEERVSRVLDALVRQREKGSTGYGEMAAALDTALAELAAQD